MSELLTQEQRGTRGSLMGDVREVLRESELFKELTDDELGKIAKLCQEEVYTAGTTIFNEGEVAEELYIVEDGRVVLEMTLRLGSGAGRQGTIDVITRGEAFGWSAISESHTLTMSARCIEGTKVIAVDGAELSRLLEDDPYIGYRVMKRLVSLVSSRLRNARGTLAHVLSIASHDLKAPLAAVESYHKVILSGYAGDLTERQEKMLLRCSERIMGLLNLIDNILDISRIDTRQLKMEATSLSKVVENVEGTIQPLAEEKGVKLEVEIPGGLPSIPAAPERLEQVFSNLLGNAVKFTGEGGTVTLMVSERSDDILIEVTDTGIGIAPEELPRIFDDFYRGTNVDSAGAGLGLSITKRIIEAHGGKVWAESPCPGSEVGSKFSLTLSKNPVATQGEKEGV
ncbi:ATP-binding protein [Chloroflexota bacterium]